jgi:hypothetical protein
MRAYGGSVDGDDEARSDEYAESDALIAEALDHPELDGEPAPPRPVDKFRRSAAGSVVAAGLLGLRDALEGRPEKEETAVVVDAPAPAAKGPIEVTLDFENPDNSRVVIRRPAPPNDEDASS